MRKYCNKFVRALVIGLSLILPLSGCAAAVGVLGTIGSGVATGAEYVMGKSVSKTTSHDFDRVKKALLVALCKMQIEVETASEIEGGEEILANADDLRIEIELKKITPRVTSIKIRTSNGFLLGDKATAQEIVQQTTEIAEKLIT